jgi:hypothetical protein
VGIKAGLDDMAKRKFRRNVQGLALGLTEIEKYPNQDIRCSSRDWNRTPPE